MGVLPTLQPAAASFGRIYAAYDGVFVVLSLAWGWWIDGGRPGRWDLLGGALAVAGVAIIMYAPRGRHRVRHAEEWFSLLKKSGH